MRDWVEQTLLAFCRVRGPSTWLATAAKNLSRFGSRGGGRQSSASAEATGPRIDAVISSRNPGHSPKRSALNVVVETRHHEAVRKIC